MSYVASSWQSAVSGEGGRSATDGRLRLGRAVVLGGTALVLVLVFVCAFDLMRDRSAAIRTAERQARNLAEVLSAQTIAVISGIDQSISRVFDAIHNRPLASLSGDESLRRLFVDMIDHVPFMRALYIFDAEGKILVTTRSNTNFTVADREYFAFHRDRPDPSLFVGPPIFSRANGKQALTLSRRINAPDGSFAGLVLGILDPEYLQKLYDAIDVGRFGIVSLLRLDGRMLVRSPFDPKQVGFSVAKAPLFRAMVEGGARSGIDRGRYVSDGRIRIAGYEIIEPGPLVMRVALDEDEVLTEWRQTVLFTLGGTAGFLGLLLLLTNMLRTELQRRERVEEALRQSERLARSTINALTAELCVLDETGKIIIANQAWLGANRGGRGIGADYLASCETCNGPGCTACEGAEAADMASFAAGIRAVMAGTRAEHIQEYAVVEPEGRRWFIGRVTRFTGNGPVRVVIALRDITPRRRMVDNLRESERRLAKAQTIARLGNWEADLSSGIIWWSDEVYRLFGRTPKDFAAGFADYLEFIHPDDREALHEQGLLLASAGRPINYDHRVILPNGEARIFNLQAELAEAEEGKPERILGIVHDVTERKRAELELRNAIEQTAIANRTKTEFLANMSHELNTPLNAVIGFSEMMVEELFGPHGHPKYLEFSRLVHQSGRHLQQLIGDVLDIARIDTGEIVLEEEVLDLAELVRGRLQYVQTALEEGGLVLKTCGLDQSLGLLADRRIIKQIVRNLLSNAVKFTPPGGLITVSAGQEQTGALYLTITDTGPGMAPEDIVRALDRFSQVDGGLSRKHDGIGIGLSLAKQRVENHGGILEITSVAGQGTTVAVRFPPERASVLDDVVERGTVLMRLDSER
ncbi:MAG: ATP-binding protein [Rhodospirillaceae bacterium]